VSTVLVDNTGLSAVALSATTVTIGSFAVGSGASRCIYLAVSQWKATDLQPTAAFDPTGVNQAFLVHDSVTIAESPGTRRITLFKLVNASNITANIVVTWGSACDEVVVGADSWTNVDQTTPFSAAVKASSPGSTPSSISVPNAVGDVVHSAISADAGSGVSIVSNQTQRWRAIASGGTTEGAGQSADGTGSNITMTFSGIQGGQIWTHIGVAIQQASGGAAVPTQTPLRNPLPAFKRAFGKSSLALRPRQMPAAPGVATFAGLNVDTSQAVPIGGSAAVAVLDQVTSSQAVPVAGAASVSVAEQVTSSQSVAPGGSVTLSVLEQLTSTRAVPIGGSIALGVAVQVSSVQAVPINGAIGAAVLVQITSTQQIPIGGTISGGSGAIVTSAASVLIGGNIAVSALEQLASSIQVLLGGSATIAVRLQVTSAVPVPLAGLIAAAIGLAGSSSAAIPLSGSITISVAAPFTGTHLDEPLSIDFDALATAIDFTSLATTIDFDAIETVLVFLDGGTDVLELTILKGELTPIAMTLQGADPVTGALVKYDVSAASSVQLNVGKPGAALIVSAKDLAKTDGANGRVTYNPASPETDVAGKYDALVVATFPGSPGVVRKFPGKLTIRDAIA
jgi:hypothetical protein